MDDPKEHSKLLVQAGRATLKPLGFVQKGTSRTFLSDEGIWSCIVEFQPSSFARGSYLNVGAHWLWTRNDHLSFDYGYRKSEFIDALDVTQFADAASHLANRAAAEAVQLRAKFGDASAIAGELANKEVSLGSRGGDWNAFDCGVASGLAGDWETARRMFELVIAGVTTHDWVIERQTDAKRLLQLTGHPEDFHCEISSRILATRKRLKFPLLEQTIK